MLKNYLKITLRNLWKHRGFSGLNIAGLSVGLTATFLIVQFIGFEMSYDNFHTKKDNIYRITADIKTPSDLMKTDRPAIAVPPNLKTQFEEVEDAIRIMSIPLAVHKENIKFKEKNAYACDPTLFEMFDYKLLQGDKNVVLQEPFSIVMDEETAKRYFKETSPIGQTLILNNEDINNKVFTVTGVMQKAPSNSRFQPEMIISWSTYTKGVIPDLDERWGLYDPEAFVLLNPNVDPQELVTKFPDFLQQNSGQEMENNKTYVTLHLERFDEVYMHSPRTRGVSGSISAVYTFSIIAAFILLIACINFINLTTARSVERAKEVGVRKVIGAGKHQLSLQFLGESVIIALLSFLVAVALTALVLPYFNELVGKEISEGIFSKPNYLIILFVVSLLIGAVAGIYPAFVLSSFKPVNVLKGNFSTGTRGVLLRKGLVIAQFTISIALIIGTIVIYNQMDYMTNQELGFKKEHTVVLETGHVPAREALKTKLNTIPEVRSTSYSASIPGVNNHIAYTILEDYSKNEQIVNMQAFFVDFNFIPQYGLKLLAGRAFSESFASDSTKAMIINEKAVSFLGYTKPEEAIGANFSQWGKEGHIIGVIQDFHFKSLEESIQPMSITVSPSGGDHLSVVFQSNNLSKTIETIEKEWNILMPTNPFNYYFLDEAFDSQYKTHQQFSNILINFAILAIFISCLGLLGLAAYSMLQRRREIGIRKVLGASVTTVVNLLSIDFMKLVIIAFLIASPISWLTMRSWLNGFAYKIDIKWWMFAIAGISALVIALTTVGFHALKASLANPIKSIRTE